MTIVTNRFVVASITPRLLDIHGDAQNAQVLAARARWAGHSADAVEVHTATDAAGLQPNAVVIGSGFDSDAVEVLGELEAIADSMLAWAERGVPMLAVGLGWELLSASTEIEPGSALTGLGIFSGRFERAQRDSGPAVLDSRWGRVVGYEYHSRDYVLGEDEDALGTVLAGHGNLSGAQNARAEGAVRASRFGTMLRGPILARNPRLADAMLGEFASSGAGVDGSRSDGDRHGQRLADEYADRANRRVVGELGL